MGVYHIHPAANLYRNQIYPSVGVEIAAIN